jgi:hypothetical protein
MGREIWMFGWLKRFKGLDMHGLEADLRGAAVV